MTAYYYHANKRTDIDGFCSGNKYLTASYHDSNWLGRGTYFWENDPIRAELWLNKKKEDGAILQCEIDTDQIINLVERNKSADDFYEFLSLYDMSRINGINDRKNLRFPFDCNVFDRVRLEFQDRYKGIRMAFFLGDSVTNGGNIFTDQHVQVCLWDTGIMYNPKRYIAGMI